MTNIEKIREACIKTGILLTEYKNCCGNDVIRPIRLADVLLAIEANRDGKPVLRTYSDGELVVNEDEDRKRVFWNLRQDDLILQSEETINFIYSLLSHDQ